MTAESFLNQGREMDLSIHEDQKTPRRLNLNRAALRHIIIIKNQRKLKTAKEKSYIQGTPIKLVVNLSTGTIQARNEREDIFEILLGGRNEWIRIL